MLICQKISSISNILNCPVTIVTKVVTIFQCFHMLLIQGCLYVLIYLLHFFNKVGQTTEFVMKSDFLLTIEFHWPLYRAKIVRLPMSIRKNHVFVLVMEPVTM